MQKNIVKKIASDVDNCAAFSEKRYQMICQIQNFLKEGCSYREIAKLSIPIKMSTFFGNSEHPFPEK